MKRLLPTGAEVAVFAALAVACALIASLTRAADLAMAVFAVPIFVVAAWMGMRRSGQWGEITSRRPAEVPVEAAVASIDEEAAV